MILYLAQSYFHLSEYYLCLELCYELARIKLINPSSCILISKCLCKCGLLIAAENWLNHAKTYGSESNDITEAENLLEKCRTKCMAFKYI